MFEEGLQVEIDRLADKATKDLAAAKEEWLLNLFDSLEEAEKYKGKFEIEETTSYNTTPKYGKDNNVTFSAVHEFRLVFKPDA